MVGTAFTDFDHGSSSDFRVVMNISLFLCTTSTLRLNINVRPSPDRHGHPSHSRYKLPVSFTRLGVHFVHYILNPPRQPTSLSPPVSRETLPRALSFVWDRQIVYTVSICAHSHSK